MGTRLPVIGLLSCLVLAPAGLCAKSPQEVTPLVHLQGLVPKAERTQVMVLGTFHFREIKGRFKPSMVEPLLKKLEAFKPDVIAVERLPGSLVHELELRAKATPVHEEVLTGFAAVHLDLGHEAQGLLKRDMIQASKALASQAVAPQDLEARGPAAWARQALLELAAYELPSALLSWSRVPAEDLEARSQVPAPLAIKLDAQLAQINEVQALAIPLARRLGHPGICGVDEFEDLEAIGPVMEALMASSKDSPLLATVGKSKVYQESSQRRDAAVEAGDLLPVFGHLNALAYSSQDVDAQWGVFLRTRFKDGSDRGRLALWEDRNLKIAGRIRAITARHPGKRVLVIYGAAHKPFLDAYLGTCSDLEIVQPSMALGLTR
ncbi:MAG: hypothetical protein H6P99_2567 [Holophagaceae bacterium]|nr:hypothetical protein [Holophagaceae bacterium]